jgi:LpxI N-terminal domain
MTVVISPFHSLAEHPKLGIIAGNGRFPLLVLDAARAQGYEVVVAAIKEETSPEIESCGATVHWLSVWVGHSCPTTPAQLMQHGFSGTGLG